MSASLRAPGGRRGSLALRAGRLLVAALLACGFAHAAEPSAAKSPDRPNIVFVLADDLGWTDLGCMGSKYYETPNIDRLAAEGMRFTNFCMSQNCAPTRACLMSGQYAPRTGIYTVNSLRRGRDKNRKMAVPDNVTSLPLDRKTVADVLSESGYATGMFGKWHLGTDASHHPLRRGFDEAVVSSGHRHFGFHTLPPRKIPEGAYLADYLTDLGVAFIKKHAPGPFFLYLPHFAVHAPYQAKPELQARYRSKKPSGGHRSPVYAAMIESVDRSVGKILACLDALGLREQTIVIFSSDNGGVGGYYATEPPSKRRGITDNAPLRGGKGTLYEGGLRVPFIARWPGRVRPGSVCTEPAAHVDMFPTLRDLAGASSKVTQPLDGVSLVPLLRGRNSLEKPRALYWHFPGYLESYVHKVGWRTTPAGVIREGNLKLLEFFEDGRLELYDLAEDPGERNDIAKRRAETTRRLQRKLAVWRRSIGAAMPTPKLR